MAVHWTPNTVVCERLGITGQRIRHFLEKIDGLDPDNPIFEKDKCYIWSGAAGNNVKGTEDRPSVKGRKHGAFNDGYSRVNAHRFMYEITYGIQKDVINKKDPCPCGSKRIYQSCCRPVIKHRRIEITGLDHNGACVNPLHLALGDHCSNQHDIRKDGTGKGKHCIGTSHGGCTITEDVARHIWMNLQNNLPHSVIQDLHDLPTKNIVKDISRGKTWTHVTGLNPEKFKKQELERKEHKYWEECKRRKSVLESKGFVYYGDVAPDVATNVIEEAIEETERICTMMNCLFQGTPQHIDNFAWKTKEHISRRTVCKQCKTNELNDYRAKKRSNHGTDVKECNTTRAKGSSKFKSSNATHWKCNSCQIELPREEFSATNLYKTSTCKECQRKNQAQTSKSYQDNRGPPAKKMRLNTAK